MSSSLTLGDDPTTPTTDLTASPVFEPRGEAPIRAELYGIDRLEALARRLATASTINPKSNLGDNLLGRFAQNADVLLRTHRRIVGEVDRPEGRGIDADWLADNFYIVEDALREIKQDLPSGYYSELPKLADGPARDYPRVYALAQALVAHTDSELDEARIVRFVEAYQASSQLTIGELWAVPTMLRLVLVENLRRLAERMVRSWDEARLADAWVIDHIPAPPSEESEGDREPVPAATLPPLPALAGPTVVRLVRLLRDRGAVAEPALRMLEDQLAERGSDAARVLRDEHRRQAANQVSVGNCVISLRLLSAIDWNAFFEEQSAVEVLLRDEPSGVYARQDFATRDRYRRVIEKIARRSNVAEEQVARRVVGLASRGMVDGPAKGHVGYYLIDKGRPVLLREFPYQAPVRERLHDFVVANPGLTYFGSIFLLMLALIVPLVAFGTGPGVGFGLLVLLVLALILPASDIAVGMVNHVVTLLMPPRKLARLDFKEGIPADCRAFVVVPSMLVRNDSAANLLERLEITYLANPDLELRFALLTDFADAPEEHRPEDDGYILAALDGVKTLNRRHAGDGPDKFFLFHRRRTWNPVQGVWMGWERKRGKLSEFNRLLRGDNATNYIIRSAEPADLPRARFVITLDADTILPRESARRLVGTLAHPLNAPIFDPAKRRVVAGHGVLQPRVSYHLFAATRSRFAGLLAASAGIDPYSNAVSDVYMDLFDVGTFTGKGIYDVDAFEAAVGHAFPENAILSHDLIEGNFARCGLVTDVELFDDFPPRYHAYALREHRWARGDWQLLPWLGRTVPTADGPRPNPLPTLERWKILDNLRRSVVPPALVFLLVLGWTVLPGSPWTWTAFALAVPALPIVQLLFGTLVSAIRGGSFAPILGLGHDFPPTAGQVLLWIAFLADRAQRLVDAIVRTLNRLFVSHQRMLEWETAAATEHRLGTGIGDFVRSMWTSVAWALGINLVVALVRPSALPAALPVLAAWLVSPVVAFWVSRPPRPVESPLTDAERAELRRIARKTWHFFETFVGDEDHWLPPDNYQEDSIGSGGRVAHRTSPTNKGMLLLSTLAAHDLGYLNLKTLLDRLEKTFDTFDKMEKHEGHLYNWYNTQTLRTLPPNYVSTVDSGNLLGCLVTLKQGMREKMAERFPGPNVRDGLVDTLVVLVRDVQTLRPSKVGEEYREFDRLVQSIRNALDLHGTSPADLMVYGDWLDRIAAGSGPLAAKVAALPGVTPATMDRWSGYAGRFEALLRERIDELESIAPWVSLRRAPESFNLILGGPSESSERFIKAVNELNEAASPIELAGRIKAVLDLVEPAESLAQEGETLAKLRRFASALKSSGVADLAGRCERLGKRADDFGNGMNFRFLYKDDRHLFSIGMNMQVGRLDASCYDLMASEACLSSFLAISRGDAPRRHWFQLGRPFIETADRIGLLSWGGSMFEYLMPRLMILPLKGTLLDQAHRTAVARQMEYGRQKGIPWGISESAYAAFTADGDYHYQSFGTPGLGLKRDIGNELVITPYATALAVAVRPREALENFKKLAAEGGEGRYGFHEAVDFTRERVPKGKRSIVVRSYMAHHHGMSLVALANALLDEPMPRRFHSEPMIRAAELLLQERVPRGAPIIEPSASEPPSAVGDGKGEGASVPLMSRRLSTPATPSPRTHLLSNTQYAVMLTNAGSGYSTCRGIDVTRWREDATRDACGLFLYIKDVATEMVWSAGHQPTCRPADHYEAIFSADKVAFRRLDASIETVMEVTVSPESRAEIRRVTLTNHDTRVRELELTSYAEVVLLGHGADVSHPAFGKLFLETEWAAGPEALICRRRPRSTEQVPVYAVHLAASDAPSPTPTQFETDRARFLGRGRSPADPAALDPAATLSGTIGAVLDPVFSLRRRVRVEPGASAVVAFITAVADSREEALTLADHYREISAVARAFELAWAHIQVEHRHRNWSAQDAHLYQRLGSHVLYASSALRADPAILLQNTKGQPGLWAYGISGDKPIVLAFIADFDEVALAAQLLFAHTYLKTKGLDLDLVILAGRSEGDADDLHQHLLDLVRGSDARDWVDRPGGVYVRKLAAIPGVDQILLQSYAHVVLYGDRGTLGGQLDRIDRVRAIPEPFVPTGSASDHPEPKLTPVVETPELLFNNGTGGFTPDGLEYRIAIPGTPRPDIRRNGKADRENPSRPILPPAPWVNVIANPNFGFIASEGGAGYSWAGNSQTNRLTPWSNDPVTDPPGEVLYLRDEETGDVWTPTPLPIPSIQPTVVRHGQGYTVYERVVGGLEHRLTLLVPPEDPVKVIHLDMTNTSDRPRTLSATFYAEWVLGTARDQAPMQVTTWLDDESGLLMARNPFHPDFSTQIAFVGVGGRRPISATSDRGEFLGRNGSVAAPAALGRVALGGHFGAGLDPCAAIQVKFEVAPGAAERITFVLGQAETVEEARRVAGLHRESDRFAGTLESVKGQWRSILGAVQVKTPDAGMDLVLNHWLLYQALSCRFWGRSATYQSGGAYGFRDQLQDSMALVYGAPGEARAQLLRAADRQFLEGDVQHWWHPPAGKGVRTRICDDLIFLPYVACHYVATTGDVAILDEVVPFLEAPVLKPGQEDDYGLPAVSKEAGTLYEHCVRALDHAQKVGVHGLSLMGTGDWNDGMNRVGVHGRGESVWNSWFLIAALRDFAKLAESRGDHARSATCLDRAEALRSAIEAKAWDGAWYRRAYFDDGTPLGSATNEECQIDSIAQSWAAISGVADPGRVDSAMKSVDERLVHDDDGVILLFTPPFDGGKLQPGYIKGYVPGVRENGGQYTHAATWLVLAAAIQGRGRRAFELFDLLNPVKHATDPESVARYKVEPYVVAADIYGRPPHTGRGGWTWYTGSASWLFRVGLEAILGFHLRGDHLAIEPKIPETWTGFEVNYRRGAAHYRVVVENPDGVEHGVKAATLDGQPVDPSAIPLVDDGRKHEVSIRMGT